MARRAVLFGCNYAGTDSALSGCINDVWSVHEMLVQAFGFQPEDIEVLTDDREPKPTGENMKAAITRIVRRSEPGDVLFIHYSGHGTQVPITDNDPEEEEVDGFDEAICPCDMNLITDDDFADLLAPLPEGVKCTLIADCCHSGTLLDYGEIALDLGDPNGAAHFSRAALNRSMEARGYGRNRSLPYQEVANMLSQLFGGKDVPYNRIFQSIKQNFGAAATNKTPGSKLLGFVSDMAQMTLSGNSGGGYGSAGYGNASSGYGGGYGSSGGGFGGGGHQGGGLGSMLSGVLSAASGSSSHQPSHAPTPLRPNTAHASRGAGCLVSGCRDEETSADACPSGDKSQAFGALTNALTTTIRNNTSGRPLTNAELVTSVRHFLAAGGYKQNPCLSCSERNANATFII